MIVSHERRRILSAFTLSLAAASLVAACSPPPPARPAPPPKPVAVAVPPPPAAAPPLPEPEPEPTPASACAALAREHADAVAGSPFTSVAAFFGQCGLPSDPARCEPTFDGANLLYGIRSSATFSDPVLVDLDGDGEPELYIKREGKHQNQDLQGTDVIWTFRDGAVVPFPFRNGPPVEELRDVDGDGRMDIVTHDPYRTDGAYACGLLSMDIYRVVGPELLVHARPDGGYSMDDAEAKAFARKQCPRRPKRIGGAKGDVGVDIACALLWGVSVRAIERNIASCAPRPGEAYEPHCPEWCAMEKEYLRSFAAATPPLRLDKP